MKKYQHTLKDARDDSALIQEFSMRFLNRFNLKYENILRLNEKQSHLGYGSCSIFLLDEVSYSSKNLIINKQPFVHIATQINPNGIDSSGKIGRTFTIKFELMCHHKEKYQRQFNEKVCVKFYDYSKNMDELLDRFEKFMLKTYYPKINELCE
jgi:hypothetical protein